MACAIVSMGTKRVRVVLMLGMRASFYLLTTRLGTRRETARTVELGVKTCDNSVCVHINKREVFAFCDKCPDKVVVSKQRI
jgi:hypothetical protein